MTVLFLALLLIEFSDVIFSIDSVPAIFAITKEPLIVFTSNIFAILGLRSLYYLLAGMIEKFRYLKPALVSLLLFIGVKMIISETYEIPLMYSLAVIFSILTIAIAFSVIKTQRLEWRYKY